MSQSQIEIDYTQAINELANRLRILEAKQSLFSEKLLVIGQNMIEENKKVLKEIKVLDAENKEVKKDLAQLTNIVKHLSEEAGRFAKQSDVKVLEKYINLWNPMHFVSEEDVHAIVQAALEAQKSSATKTRKNDAGRHTRE